MKYANLFLISSEAFEFTLQACVGDMEFSISSICECLRGEVEMKLELQHRNCLQTQTLLQRRKSWRAIYSHKNHCTKFSWRIFQQTPKLVTQFLTPSFAVYKKAHKGNVRKQLNITFRRNEVIHLNVMWPMGLNLLRSNILQHTRNSSFPLRRNLHFKLHALKFDAKRLRILRNFMRVSMVYVKNVAAFSQPHFNIFHFNSLFTLQGI